MNAASGVLNSIDFLQLLRKFVPRSLLIIYAYFCHVMFLNYYLKIIADKSLECLVHWFSSVSALSALSAFGVCVIFSSVRKKLFNKSVPLCSRSQILYFYVYRCRFPAEGIVGSKCSALVRFATNGGDIFHFCYISCFYCQLCLYIYFILSKGHFLEHFSVLSMAHVQYCVLAFCFCFAIFFMFVASLMQHPYFLCKYQ